MESCVILCPELFFEFQDWMLIYAMHYINARTSCSEFSYVCLNFLSLATTLTRCSNLTRVSDGIWGTTCALRAIQIALFPIWVFKILSASLHTWWSGYTASHGLHPQANGHNALFNTCKHDPFRNTLCFWPRGRWGTNVTPKIFNRHKKLKHENYYLSHT